MDPQQIRHLLHMKRMIRIVKSKKAFDAYLKALERKVRMGR